MSTTTPTLSQLQQALAIAEQIDQLERELASIIGGRSAAPPAASVAPPKTAGPGRRGGKRVFSAESRAKMAAAQKARWAGKSRSAPAAVAKASPNKRTMSPETKAKMAAAMKARWAAAKRKGVPGPNARK